MMFRARITFFFVLDFAPLPGAADSILAMRRLRRGGASGARARDRNLFALGVGRSFTVFFVTVAMNPFHWDRAGELEFSVGVASDTRQLAARDCLCHRV